MSLGERIKEARADSKFTQRDLADAMGVDPITVSRWERGTIDIPVSRLREIAAATGKSVAFFVSEAAA